MQMQRILVALFLFLAIPLALADKPSSDENKSESHEEGHSASTHSEDNEHAEHAEGCLLYTSPSPRDRQKSRMPSSA